jgi:RNA polymerase sigma-70 factor (ECF subfamily)
MVASMMDGPEGKVMDDVETLMSQAARLGALAARARKDGKEPAADGFFREAFGLAAKAASQTTDVAGNSIQQDILRTAVVFALSCGEVAAARRLIDEALAANPAIRHSEAWAQILEVTAWPDEWLLAAVRRDPPDVDALEVLADRYWRSLLARCQMLTLNEEKAADLAQQAWCKVLRARHSLKPGGNFPAFITTVATNLWRDSGRSAKRAGQLSENRLASLDAALPTDDGGTMSLGDLLPDLNALNAVEQKLLAQDIDRALEQLTPLLREVLVSRLLDGESCAEIGRRHGRTEQTISGWLRQALQEMRRHLQILNRTIVGDEKS